MGQENFPLMRGKMLDVIGFNNKVLGISLCLCVFYYVQRHVN